MRNTITAVAGSQGESVTKLAVLMDPIENIDPQHDSSFSMLVAAAQKGWVLYYLQARDLYAQQQTIKARVRRLRVRQVPHDYYQLGAPSLHSLTDFDIVLMRKDPPFNMEYLYLTYLLEQAEAAGVLVVNKAQSLRDANEKLFILWFKDYCTPTLVSAEAQALKAFWQQHGEVILKPLNGMGGRGIFYLGQNEANINVIIETLTQRGQTHIMAQRYLAAIKTSGDKRILLIDGKPVDYALARIPAAGDIRGNMAAGATVKAVKLTSRDREICAAIAPTLRRRGLLFVGLDVIGDYMSEINVTSATGIQELERLADLHIAADFIRCLEAKLNEK